MGFFDDFERAFMENLEEAKKELGIKDDEQEKDEERDKNTLFIDDKYSKGKDMIRILGGSIIVADKDHKPLVGVIAKSTAEDDGVPEDSVVWGCIFGKDKDGNWQEVFYAWDRENKKLYASLDSKNYEKWHICYDLETNEKKEINYLMDGKASDMFHNMNEDIFEDYIEGENEEDAVVQDWIYREAGKDEKTGFLYYINGLMDYETLLESAETFSLAEYPFALPIEEVVGKFRGGTKEESLPELDNGMIFILYEDEHSPDPSRMVRFAYFIQRKDGGDGFTDVIACVVGMVDGEEGRQETQYYKISDRQNKMMVINKDDVIPWAGMFNFNTEEEECEFKWDEEDEKLFADINQVMNEVFDIRGERNYKYLKKDFYERMHVGNKPNSKIYMRTYMDSNEGIRYMDMIANYKFPFE